VKYVVVAVIHESIDESESVSAQRIWSQTFSSEVAAIKCAEWLDNVEGSATISVEIFVDNPDTDK
jgi:hypothetical protein